MANIKLNWMIYLGNNDEVMTIISMPMPGFNEDEGMYTDKQIIKLNQLIREIPHPVWSEDDYICKQQINEYSKLIRNMI